MASKRNYLSVSLTVAASATAALLIMGSPGMARATTSTGTTRGATDVAPPRGTVAPPGSAGRSSSSNYVIHANDQLSVVVYGEQSLTQTVTVLPNGDIEMPLVGTVRVGGKTPDQAAHTISAALQKYVRHPVVTVSVTQQGLLDVLVLGNVKTPGKYQLSPTSRLTDAIAAAGGIGPTDGPYPDARVAGPNGSASLVSLQKLLHDGDTSNDVAMQSGEIVYIPAPIQINIEVVGAVDHPGEIALNEGDRLSMAIAKAGNSANAGSDLNNIRVTRTGPDGKPQIFNINLYKELEGGDVSKDLVMQKGDVVYVPESKKGAAGHGGDLTGAAAILTTLRLLIFHI